MTSLIKSSQLSGEPVVLNPPQRGDDMPEAMPFPSEGDFAAVSFEDGIDEREESVLAAAAAADADAASEIETGTEIPTDAALEPVSEQESSFSYEDYRRRFEAELGAIEEQAKQQGFERGQADGFEQVKAEYAEQIEALAKLIASMREALDQTIEGVAEVGTEVVCESVAKVIGEAVVERAAIISAVRQVIRRTKDRTKLVVRLSPADWAMLEEHQAMLVEGLNVGSVELMADDRVQAGGCLLETPAGNLDGRFEVQLARLCEALRNARSASDETEAAA